MVKMYMLSCEKMLLVNVYVFRKENKQGKAKI